MFFFLLLFYRHHCWTFNIVFFFALFSDQKKERKTENLRIFNITAPIVPFFFFSVGFIYSTFVVCWTYNIKAKCYFRSFFYLVFRQKKKIVPQFPPLPRGAPRLIVYLFIPPVLIYFSSSMSILHNLMMIVLNENIVKMRLLRWKFFGTCACNILSCAKIVSLI